MSTPNEPRRSQCLEPTVTNLGPDREEPEPSSQKSLEDVVSKRKFDDTETNLDAPPSKVPKTFVKHKTHWFPDGNVLFQIGDTRFKLYCGRMSRESSWFEALMNQRMRGAPSEPYHHQSKIDQALKSVERVDELDLFYLDFVDGPTAKEFGTLLSAMEEAVEHLFQRPSFKKMVNIYKTAHFFCMQRYISYGERYLEDMFPDSVESIPKTPSPYAARALVLGFKHDFTEIARRCYYDVARIHPLRIPEEEENPNNCENKPDHKSDSSSENDDTDAVTRTRKSSRRYSVALKDASTNTFIRLLNIQRELALSWDRIWNHLNYQCPPTETCKAFHTGRSSYKKFKERYPFDPIISIRRLLAFKEPDLKTYCSAARDQVKEQLESERDRIWNQINSHALAAQQAEAESSES